MQTERNLYRIPATNMLRLEAEIAKLNKRAEKLGCKPVVLHKWDMQTEKHVDEILKFEYDFNFYNCSVEGDSPKLQGWELVAVLEPQKNGEMLVKEVPGQKCPATYRVTDMHCDHCEAIRKRNAVYVLKHQRRGYKQVGRSCLADFLGGVSPEALLNMGQFLLNFCKLFKDAQEDSWGCGGRQEVVVALERFVTISAALIRNQGWLSKNDAFNQGKEHLSTSSLAWNICVNPNGDSIRIYLRDNNIDVTYQDIKLSQDAIKWAAALDSHNTPNNYLHDMGVCCRQQFVTYKMRGYVASLINAYQKEMFERVATSRNQAPKPSVFVGELGKRQEFKNLEIMLANSVNQEGQFPKTLVKFQDPQNNVFIWWASGRPEWLKLGEVFDVKATVSGHNEYKGSLQTTIKRVTPKIKPALLCMT